MLSGGPVQSIANLAKGQDRGNAVTIQVSSFHPEVRVNVFFLLFFPLFPIKQTKDNMGILNSDNEIQRRQYVGGTRYLHKCI